MSFIHLYYGFGKGKTTSVMGLAIRALGAGKKVAIIQFDKGFDGENEHYSERFILRKLKTDGYPIELYPTGCERMMPDGTFRFKNQDEDFREAKRGLAEAKRLLSESTIDLLIMDEGLAAVAYHLIKEEELMEIISLYEAKGRPCELVISGHKVWPEIEEKADLITEMRKVKHYFDKGVPARLGIEF
ncbi:MAG: cob(I)yrinic acid a,c-diamide adenosyltransferase [Chloroherpetonaceae bacterium]|nr:cob(I)yrinic acid a,c-diamide adenosyltransferase [Chloroherpetonaceae bacterium]